jgi:hypothetical protein
MYDNSKCACCGQPRPGSVIPLDANRQMWFIADSPPPPPPDMRVLTLLVWIAVIVTALLCR